MTLTKSDFAALLDSAASALAEQSDRFSEIDSRFGDGDHGITIAKIAALIKKELSQWTDASIQQFLAHLGDGIMGVNGGSAGPLYGTMIGGLADAMGDETEIDAPLLKKMFAASLSAMQDITTAKVGDKTMMDALIPAVEAAFNAPDDIAAVLQSAADAAQAGAKNSENFMSKFGRAKSYKEQTIGTPDAGAMSTSTFFTGLQQGLGLLSFHA